MEWERKDNLLAERFKKEEIPGFLTKEFTAKDNEFVVVERGREIYRERGPGKFSIKSFVGDLTDVLLVDKSERAFSGVIKNVCLVDEKTIDIKIIIKFRIFNSDHFSKNLMGERKRFFMEDFWDDVLSEIIYKKVLPGFKKKPLNEYRKEDVKSQSRDTMESEIKKTFKDWGLTLSSFSIDYEIPEKTEDSEKQETEEDEEQAMKDIKKYDTEMDKDEDKPDSKD